MIVSKQILPLAVFESNIHDDNGGCRGRRVVSMGIPYSVRCQSRHAV